MQRLPTLEVGPVSLILGYRRSTVVEVATGDDDGTLEESVVTEPTEKVLLLLVSEKPVPEQEDNVFLFSKPLRMRLALA